jgi:hypothetical protein
MERMRNNVQRVKRVAVVVVVRRRASRSSSKTGDPLSPFEGETGFCVLGRVSISPSVLLCLFSGVQLEGRQVGR